MKSRAIDAFKYYDREKWIKIIVEPLKKMKKKVRLFFN